MLHAADDQELDAAHYRVNDAVVGHDCTNIEDQTSNLIPQNLPKEISSNQTH